MATMRNPAVGCVCGSFYEPRLIWAGVHLRRTKPPPSSPSRPRALFSPCSRLAGLISPPSFLLIFLLRSTKALAFLVPRISSSSPRIPSRKIGYGIRICRVELRSVVNSAMVVNNAAAVAAPVVEVVETKIEFAAGCRRMQIEVLSKNQRSLVRV